MYDRTIADHELSFEASGALRDASLVMRDRETDSWWSIMAGEAIGGDLKGAPLRELPHGEKTTWGDWVERHPETRVLSVDGQEHMQINHYERYFASDGTFRGLEVDDARLNPKEPIFSFRVGGRPHAVPHSAFEGGACFDVPALGEDKLILFREPDASIFAGTKAWIVPDSLAEACTQEGRPDPTLLEEHPDLEVQTGFDTYWYVWIAANEDSVLLR